MRRFSSFISGVIVGGLLVYGALNYHLVRANDGMYVIPKLNSRLSQAYVDIRGFSPAQWASHRSLAAAIIQADNRHLLQDSAIGGFSDGVKNALDHLTD